MFGRKAEISPRIFMLLQQFYPIVGGAEIQAQRLATKLVEWGNVVSVITNRQKAEWPAREVLDGVEIRRMGFPLPYRFMENSLPLFGYLLRHRREFDILHCHQAFHHAVVSILAAKLLRKRCIVKIACAGRFGDLYVGSTFAHFRKALSILYLADRVIAISSQVKEELLEFGFPPERILFIPNGVDVEYFSRTVSFPSVGKWVFLHAGRRHPQKGIDVLLKAVRILQRRFMANCFEVRCFGHHYPEYDYPRLARRLGVEFNVRFFPPSSDMRARYQEAHCLVLPSRGEGLSNTLLEAMSLEMPVITTEVSGNLDVVVSGQNGLLVPVGDPVALAEAMGFVMSCFSEAKCLGRQARETVERRFSLRSVAERYQSLYSELLGLRRGEGVRRKGGEGSL
ncbi:MAG: glycosyltransferase family 1 protein [Planctomycetota bacterium]|nr:MAG: glycosyltransferase family 1 protein [Planctomycetota bacterium]